MSATVVNDVLEQAADKEAKFKSITVNKELDVEVDPGNLLACDPNSLTEQKFRGSRADLELYLKSLARDNTQILLNEIWQLPTERKEDVIIAKLPPPTYRLPREKKIPKPKPPTKWELFARAKGISNQKKGRMVWDGQSKSYKPRWGYKRANDDTKDWLIEVPENADPYEDQFAKRKEAKKERIAKNELQRYRNIIKAQGKRNPKAEHTEIVPTENPSKQQVAKALAVAKVSTPSLGKFSKKISKEEKHINVSRKRKFESNIGNVRSEKQRQLDILENLQKKKPVLDITKAVSHQMQTEQISAQEAKKGEKAAPRKKSRKHGGKKSKISGKGNPSHAKGMGNRNRGGSMKFNHGNGFAKRNKGGKDQKNKGKKGKR